MSAPATLLTDPAPAPGRDPASLARGLGLLFGLVAVWLETRSYMGLGHDAIFYAMLAQARLPGSALAQDIFVAMGSQDAWTLFSPLYAVVISRIGLEHAALLLTLVFNALAVVAAALLARRLLSRTGAWLALAWFIAIPGLYGASNVFSYLEPFTTSRTLAEAAVLGALTACVARRPRVTAALLAAGLAIHPLITAPGILLAALLWLPLRAQAAAVAAIAAGAAAVAALALTLPIGPVSVMDGQWLALVRARSPFLFVADWNILDWQRCAVPLATLAISSAVLPIDGLPGRAARAALALGAAAFAVAWIATAAVPVTIVIQGQPWRWMWLSKAIAVLLLVPTFGVLLRRSGTSRIAAVVLAAAWLGFEDGLGMVAALVALLLAYVDGVRPGSKALLALAALVSAPLVWGVIQLTSLWLYATVVAGATALWWLLFHAPLRVAPVAAALGATFLCGSALASTARIESAQRFNAAMLEAYAPWRAQIPFDATVLAAEDAPLVWFALQRRSYISATQSVGVTFSRAAALEMSRRIDQVSDYVPRTLLLDWLSPKLKEPVLSVALLDQLCAAPGLDFIVAADRLPRPHLAQMRNLPAHSQYLYACRPESARALATTNTVSHR